MPPVKMRGDGRMAKDPKKTLLRLLSYLKRHIGVLAIVVACIFVVAFAQITCSTALGRLVDDFILPMVAEGSADFAPLFRFIVQIACVFVLGMAGSFFQSYLMVGVTQGVQKTIRDELNCYAFDTGFPVDHAWLMQTLGPDVTVSGGVHVDLLRTGTPETVLSSTEFTRLFHRKEGAQ